MLTSQYDSFTIIANFWKGFLILIMWNYTDTPLAYFISFRTYGTWLHGDARGSIDRHHNIYGMSYMELSKDWHRLTSNC